MNAHAETKLYRSSERRRTLAQALESVSALWAEYSHNPDVFIEKLMEKVPISFTLTSVNDD
jgi:Tfp pilus assembly protein PilN